MLYELFILLAGAFLCHGYAGFLVPIYWNGVEMIFKALFIGEIYPTSNEMWDTQPADFLTPNKIPLARDKQQQSIFRISLLTCGPGKYAKGCRTQDSFSWVIQWKGEF